MKLEVARWANGCVILAAFLVSGAEQKTNLAAGKAPEKTNSSSALNATNAPVYKFPERGAPNVRVNGGSRFADGQQLPSLFVLAPDHVGLTIKESPTLYWYQSKAGNVQLEVTIITTNQIAPVLEMKLEEPQSAGIQKLDLTKQSVKLQTGLDYQWSVALVLDPQSRSKDIVASGGIKRIMASPSLSSRLSGTPTERLAFIYAGEGIWYDALEAVSEQIEEHPGNASLRQQRTALLSQVGLQEVAAHESKQ